jgi:hypothetical protein
LAENAISNVTLVNPLSEPTSGLPAADAMIAINVMPVIRSDHAHEMFAFAQRRLESGGRFLISSYRPHVMLDQILSFEHFAYVPFAKALRRYAVTARSALEAFYSPRIRNTPRARAYHATQGMIALGEHYGLRLAAHPHALARRDAFRRIDELFHTSRFPRHFRWADWFMFEKA